MPDIKVSGTFKDYYNMLNKRLQYLHKLLQDFGSKRLAMINECDTVVGCTTTPKYTGELPAT